MKKLLLLLLIISMILSITACGKGEMGALGIRGEIKEIYTDEEEMMVQSILVEGPVEDDTMYESASVKINNNTGIYRGDEKVTVEELEEGLAVEVIFDGAVEESYPVQGTAKKIKILVD
ncbi:MAG: DUF3221 domain-containing protein [Tissierellia bacterium]|nr:DUF3221 domain-containing protein [Tissierellia bacterium]